MVAWLEHELTPRRCTIFPPPGLHRLNRTEYANAIRDLLALEIDPAKFLPSDDSTRGFDNIAGALSLSPALLEGYTSAAENQPIAIGDVTEARQLPTAFRRTLRRTITSKACHSERAADWSCSMNSPLMATTCSRSSPSTRG